MKIARTVLPTPYADHDEGMNRHGGIYRDRSAFPPSLEERMDFFQRLFSQLLVHTDGDADQALDILQRLGQRHGLFDEQIGPGEVVEALTRQSLIMANPDGSKKLTSKGEGFVRRSTLDQIFKGLKNGPLGNHQTPKQGQGASVWRKPAPGILVMSLTRWIFVRPI